MKPSNALRPASPWRANKKQAAKKFPALAGLDATELQKLLKRSTLSRDDRQIATSCLIWDMDYIEIGAAVHMDRTTVSRRMRKIIAPQLEMLQGREKDRAGAKCSGFFCLRLGNNVYKIKKKGVLLMRDYCDEAIRRANSKEGQMLMEKIAHWHNGDYRNDTIIEGGDGPSYDEFMRIMKDGFEELEEKFQKITDPKALELIGPLLDEIQNYDAK